MSKLARFGLILVIITLSLEMMNLSTAHAQNEYLCGSAAEFSKFFGVTIRQPNINDNDSDLEIIMLDSNFQVMLEEQGADWCLVFASYLGTRSGENGDPIDYKGMIRVMGQSSPLVGDCSFQLDGTLSISPETIYIYDPSSGEIPYFIPAEYIPYDVAKSETPANENYTGVYSFVDLGEVGVQPIDEDAEHNYIASYQLADSGLILFELGNPKSMILSLGSHSGDVIDQLEFIAFQAEDGFPNSTTWWTKYHPGQITYFCDLRNLE